MKARCARTLLSSLNCTRACDDKPVGIVTERDLVRRVLAESLDSESIRASSICSKPVISCSEFADLEAAVDIMKDYNIRRIAVTDDDQRLVGILT